jgi:hypothetical protein
MTMLPMTVLPMMVPPMKVLLAGRGSDLFCADPIPSVVPDPGG